MITTHKIDDDTIDVYYNKDEYLGQFERHTDGLFYFWPDEDTKGSWSEKALRSLADSLKLINR